MASEKGSDRAEEWPPPEEPVQAEPAEPLTGIAADAAAVFTMKYGEFYDRLYRYFVKQRYSESDAAEYTSETMVKLFLNARSHPVWLGPRTAQFSYVFRAGKNEAMNRKRGKKAAAEHVEFDETAFAAGGASPEQRIDLWRLWGLVMRILGTLSLRLQWVFGLAFQGYSNAEIADVLQTTEAAIRQDRSKIYRKFREGLENRDGEWIAVAQLAGAGPRGRRRTGGGS